MADELWSLRAGSLQGLFDLHQIPFRHLEHLAECPGPAVPSAPAFRLRDAKFLPHFSQDTLARIELLNEVIGINFRFLRCLDEPKWVRERSKLSESYEESY